MRDREKGIVLITTMLMLSFIIMIAALLIVSGRNTLLLGASYSDREQAQYAAECGLAYVQHCITKYKNWKGPDDSALESIYDPGLVDFYVEKIGTQSRCIKGTLNSGSCEFYVVFYDGSWDASDLRYDKSAGGAPLRYYSCNNLSNSSGTGQSMYYSGTDTSAFKTAPALSAHIIVEGRCRQAKRYTEAILKNALTLTGNSGTLAGGSVEGNLQDSNSVFLVNSIASDSRIRSMGDIKISTGDENDKNCFQIANGGTSYTGVHDGTRHTYVNSTVDPVTHDNQSDYGITVNDTDDQKKFLDNDATRLTWDEVTGDYLSGTSFNDSKVTTTIASGTWVYRQTAAGSSNYELYYYSDKFDPDNANGFINGRTGIKPAEYAGDPLIQGSGLTIANSGNAVDLSTQTGSLFTVSNPVGVSGSNGFAFLVYDCDAENEGKYQLSTTYRSSMAISGSGDPCLISNTGGDIYIGGELSGKGKVISGGELAFQGKSILKSETGGSCVSIYAKGDVTVSPVQGTGGVCDPNTAIKAAWDSIAGTGTGYYSTGTKSYKELCEKILSASVPAGTYGGAVFDTATPLYKVLCASNGFAYDKANATDLVSTTLAKNSYIGEGGSGGNKTVTLGMGKSININGYLITTSFSSPPDTVKVTVSQKLIIDPLESFNRFEPPQLLAMSGSGDISFSRDEEPGWDLVASLLPSPAITSETYTLKNNNFTEGANKLTLVTPSAPGEVSGYKATFDVDVNGTTINLNISSSSNWTITYPTSGEPGASTIQMMKSGDEKFTPLALNDTLLNGLIYSWENIKAPDVQGGSISIRGGVIAFGGDPSSAAPGSSGGNISFGKAKTVTFTYDPDFLFPLYEHVNGIDTKCIYKGFF